MSSGADNGWEGNRGKEYENDERAHEDKLRDGIHDYPALQQQSLYQQGCVCQSHALMSRVV